MPSSASYENMNRPLTNYIVEDGKFKDDFFWNLGICNVPDNLLRVHANSGKPSLSLRNKRGTSKLDENGSSETEEARLNTSTVIVQFHGNRRAFHKL